MLECSHPLQGSLTLEVAGQSMSLLPERALFLPAHEALLIADVHLGKAASFRALGVPVPEATTAATLARLDRLLAHLPARQLLVLGDLLHDAIAQHPRVIDALTAWRHAHRSLDVVLVRGNHDRRAGDPPAHCAIRVVDEPAALAGLRLRHHPLPPDSPGAEGFAVSGHLHPAIRLRGRHGAVRLPCFWFRAASLVLPAFGEFTGSCDVVPMQGDRLYLTDSEKIHALPSQVSRAA
ncbi:MAG TPA: ligase-associated DNA damage response endonuclease PdeM [Burkholderiaceae bacterium]|jgi:DNA ligase-associated metallophosphoesterase|nr:ligase-associated DNA damage response endonuclease PdeM [Burkholderiaceae bacterium]